MSATNPALEPVTLTLTAHELEVLLFALVRLLPSVRTFTDEQGNTVNVRDLNFKIIGQRLQARAHPESAT